MPLFTCFGIKNEPANSCVLWKIYKCYLKLLIDVMLINVKSQINSILNRWISYSSLLFMLLPLLLVEKMLWLCTLLLKNLFWRGLLVLLPLRALQENNLILLLKSFCLCHRCWRGKRTGPWEKAGHCQAVVLSPGGVCACPSWAASCSAAPWHHRWQHEGLGWF